MEHITMKGMPREERPYEKFFRLGPEGLSDGELLAAILRTGSREGNCLDLAQEVLALNYPQEGILGLLHHSMQELMQIKGVGRVKAVQLLCIGELSKRIWKKEALQEALYFRDPYSIASYYREEMRHREQEQLNAMFLNTKQKLIKDMMITRGTVNASIISPREVFIEALRNRAVNVILAHNHPSGDPSPSEEDCLLTRRMAEAGRLIGISLIDHIIIGDTTYVSFRERGML